MKDSIWLVMTKRKDGRIPSVVKALDAKMFFTLADAVKHKEGSGSLGQHFTIYSATVDFHDRCV